MSEKKPMIEVTGLWEKRDKNGNTFFTGSLGGVSVMIFKNSKKQKENQPDWRVYFAEKDFEKKPQSQSDDSDNLPF
jgi:uncharacterized protein (DUF736 family)